MGVKKNRCGMLLWVGVGFHTDALSSRGMSLRHHDPEEFG